MNTFTEIVQSSLATSERGRKVSLSGLGDAEAQVFTAALLGSLAAANGNRKLLIVFPTDADVGHWYRFISEVAEQITSGPGCRLPPMFFWGKDRFVNQSVAKVQRLYALNQMSSPGCSVVLTSLPALGQLTMGADDFSQAQLSFEIGQEFDQQDLKYRLIDLGYFQTKVVDEEGCFSIRGGIVDVYSPGHKDPTRLEFFGDELTSIRSFRVDNQRSKDNLSRVVFIPAGEFLISAESRPSMAQRLYDFHLDQNSDQHDRDGMNRNILQGLKFPNYEMYGPLFRDQADAALSFVPKDTLLVFPKGFETCLSTYEEMIDHSEILFKQDRQQKRPSVGVREHFLDRAALEVLLQKFPAKVEIGNPYEEPDSLRLHYAGKKIWQETEGVRGVELFDRWVGLIKGYLARANRVVVLCAQEEGFDRLTHLLAHRDINVQKLPEFWQKFSALSDLQDSTFYVGLGELEAPIQLESEGLLIIPEHAILGRQQKKPKSASKRLKNYLSSFKELKVGGLVVHFEHGIGRYQGMINLEVGGNRSDFLVLEYADNDKIYLPVDKLNLLQRYNAGSDQSTNPRLDRLRGQNWEKRKFRVKKAVKEMAEDLLKVQAKRQVAKPHAYGPIGEEYLQFESEFPFTETDDQMRAIADVNQDFDGSQAMDRLICGDVGFGKTEVAIRAAFRAVLQGYQVIILVPTTILCYQHFLSFNNRLASHGVKVAQLNRFIKGVEANLTVKGLEEGRIDVLIGTHRLLSSDIKPKKLGLLVIDEEQRFGVGHKEKLKQLKAACDIMTMTATPIPRTLHMSMLGLRDISIIATPPHDRLSVKTYVAKFDQQLVQEAIMHELKRGGQIFYVHNRVESINEVAGFLRQLLPDTEIRIAHGQMNERSLESTVVDFLEQKFSVMVCTTIIESGIDMPNVNTIIVDRADRFGLAQLYQLRGRVGRSSRQAFAYFLTPPLEKISDEALRRLDVLSAHQDLGAGFHIASHDLEIRGAGNLLGAEQSGRVGDVGLELYTNMLEEAISEIRGGVVDEVVEPEIKLKLGGILPATFIADEGHRLELYKRIFSADSAADLVALGHETKDRFGEIPKAANLLFVIAHLKVLLRQCGVKRVQLNRFEEVEITFHSLKEAQIAKVLEVATAKPKLYRLTPDYKLVLIVSISPPHNLNQQIIELGDIIGLIEPLSLSLEADEKN